MKYRKKFTPEAVKYEGTPASDAALKELQLGCHPKCAIEVSGPDLIVHSLEGPVTAKLGEHYIVRGAKDELYICETAIWEDSYVPLEEPA